MITGRRRSRPCRRAENEDIAASVATSRKLTTAQLRPGCTGIVRLPGRLPLMTSIFPLISTVAANYKYAHAQLPAGQLRTGGAGDQTAAIPNASGPASPPVS